MTNNPIECYLVDMGEIHGTRANVPETSFYPALERLLSDIGKSLSPKVRCVINLANSGAGIPDGGLFSADQFRGKSRDTDTKEKNGVGKEWGRVFPFSEKRMGSCLSF